MTDSTNPELAIEGALIKEPRVRGKYLILPLGVLCTADELVTVHRAYQEDPDKAEADALPTHVAIRESPPCLLLGGCPSVKRDFSHRRIALVREAYLSFDPGDVVAYPNLVGALRSQAARNGGMYLFIAPSTLATPIRLMKPLSL